MWLHEAITLFRTYQVPYLSADFLIELDLFNEFLHFFVAHATRLILVEVLKYPFVIAHFIGCDQPDRRLLGRHATSTGPHHIALKLLHLRLSPWRPSRTLLLLLVHAVNIKGIKIG